VCLLVCELLLPAGLVALLLLPRLHAGQSGTAKRWWRTACCLGLCWCITVLARRWLLGALLAA
jgi:hypothetical protein